MFFDVCIFRLVAIKHIHVNCYATAITIQICFQTVFLHYRNFHEQYVLSIVIICISSQDATADSKHSPALRCATCEVCYENKNACAVLTKLISTFFDIRFYIHVLYRNPSYQDRKSKTQKSKWIVNISSVDIVIKL